MADLMKHMVIHTRVSGFCWNVGKWKQKFLVHEGGFHQPAALYASKLTRQALTQGGGLRAFGWTSLSEQNLVICWAFIMWMSCTALLQLKLHDPIYGGNMYLAIRTATYHNIVHSLALHVVCYFVPRQFSTRVRVGLCKNTYVFNSLRHRIMQEGRHWGGPRSTSLSMPVNSNILPVNISGLHTELCQP